MTLRQLLVGATAAVLVVSSVASPVVAAGSGHAAAPANAPAQGPVTRVVRLESRPDIALAFGLDIAGFRTAAAVSLSAIATAKLGPITLETATRLGRASYYRGQDVDLYAVPSTAGRADETKRPGSYSVIAVPLHAVVRPDGSVAPPPTPSTGLVDPTFSNTWGDEEYFHWIYYNVDGGGIRCGTTRGEIRGQWEYARLSNVSPSSKYDYWGFSQRSVAVITKQAGRGCRNTIDWFKTKMQSLAGWAYPAEQDPRSGSSGVCVTKTLTIGASFGGVSASMSQPVERCEKWAITGALEEWASRWYGVEYDNNGLWGRLDRESAALEVVRVPKGAGHRLNTMLDLDVDNR